MKKWHALAGLLMLWTTQEVRAQPRPGVNPSARPAFSPYLNLNRRDTNAAFNYYGIVRPQLHYNSSILQLQQSTQVLQQQQQEGASPSELPATGHVSGFLSHNKYFLNRGGATPASSRPAAAAPTARTAAQPPRRGY